MNILAHIRTFLEEITESSVHNHQAFTRAIAELVGAVEAGDPALDPYIAAVEHAAYEASVYVAGVLGQAAAPAPTGPPPTAAGPA